MTEEAASDAEGSRAASAAGSQVPSGFDVFCQQELDWARRLSFLMTADSQAAEDIAQEAFARVCSRFVELENPRAYLRVVIVNLSRRHRRNRNRERVLSNDDDVAPSPSFHGSVKLADTIDRLPKRQRAVIVLRYYEGMTESEIALALSCRPGTVKSLAARALRRLREELDR